MRCCSNLFAHLLYMSVCLFAYRNDGKYNCCLRSLSSNEHAPADAFSRIMIRAQHALNITRSHHSRQIAAVLPAYVLSSTVLLCFITCYCEFISILTYL